MLHSRKKRNNNSPNFIIKLTKNLTKRCKK